jgi:predicted nucleic acid-binding protein
MYIDANVIIYAALDNTLLGDMARELMRRFGSKEIPAAVSALVVDEVLWGIQRIRGREAAAELGRIMLSMPFSWLDAGYTSIRHALEFYKQGLAPRDAFHAGIMKDYNVDDILTEDPHFDRLKWVRRKRIKDAFDEK